MKTLNLGILAHVDAGKTSLTEQLLHAAGVIDEIGRVDAGSTLTDSMALERRRGITIKSAVVNFAIEDVAVNLIDTPGHPDFIAEVERVLSVLDGAVLVISAVEGVQAQTRILMRTLQRLLIPTLIFVNKIDRRGADRERTLQEISDKLSPATIPMGPTHGMGRPAADFASHGAADADFASRLVDLLAERDDELLADYVDDEMAVSYDRLRCALAAQTGKAQLFPVFFGSAMTGAGVAALTAGIKELLPATELPAGGPVAGAVFKIERGDSGERIAFVRMTSGTVRTRDRLKFGQSKEAKVTGIRVFEGGSLIQRNSVRAGQIGTLRGLDEIQIGDTVGDARTEPEHHYFAPPTLETVVTAKNPADKNTLRVALGQLSEQDPLINLKQDDTRQEISVSLYGEVQKEVIEATLANDFDVDVTFHDTTTICIEQVVGAGSAVEFIDKAPNPFLATVGLRVEPAPIGSGVTFRLEVELGSMPYSFIKAVEETVRQTLQQGLKGWEVKDCHVMMTHSGYYPRQSHSHAVFDKSMSSTAGDFRNLTPLVLMNALQRAGTVVYEPIHRFCLEFPEDSIGPMLPALARLHAAPQAPVIKESTCTLEGDIPAAEVHELTKQLPGLTRGEGVLESAFDRHQPAVGQVPIRQRSGNDPLNRKEYLLRVGRRVS